MIKSILNLFGSLLVGMVAGILITVVGIALFTDMPLSEFIQKFLSVGFSEVIISALVALVALAVSVAILIPVHEAGHLVCGLASGYRFASFRIFNLTFIRDRGRVRVKRFAVAGTGGQCLLVPPDRPFEEIPVSWYNIGGVVANVVALLVVLPFLLMNLNPYVKEALLIFILVDIFFILLNGIPMQIGGICNDAANVRLLRRDYGSKRAIIIQLRVNALVQQGVRPKDMPEEMFYVDGDVNYANPLEFYLSLCRASRLIDMELWEEAYEMFAEFHAHRDKIMPLYAREVACELIFTSLVTGRIWSAEELYTDDLKKYVEQYRRVMSSKERMLCAVALFMDHDEERAREICNSVRKRRSSYLMQGEVASDLAIMERILNA